MIDILGVPFNSPGTAGGVAGGPAALLNAGLAQRLPQPATFVGDVDVGTPSTARDPASGLLNQDSLITTTSAVRRAIRQTLRAGRFPLLLGGDCPVLLGAIRSVQDERGATGLLFVDGHEDAWPPRLSTTGDAADSELGLALGRHRDGLPAELITHLPDLAADQVVALGPRDHEELAEYAVPSLTSMITLLTDRQLRGQAAGPADTAVHRFRGAGVPWWLHVDLDVLTTEALPAVDYPQPGGLSWADLHAITAAGLVNGCVGLSVTDYNPDLDADRRHARGIVDYLTTALTAAARS